VGEGVCDVERVEVGVGEGVSVTEIVVVGVGVLVIESVGVVDGVELADAAAGELARDGLGVDDGDADGSGCEELEALGRDDAEGAPALERVGEGVAVGVLVDEPVPVPEGVGLGVALSDGLGKLPEADALGVGELDGVGGRKDELALGRREGDGENANEKLRTLVTATATPCPLFPLSLLNCRNSALEGVDPFVSAAAPVQEVSKGALESSPLRALKTS